MVMSDGAVAFGPIPDRHESVLRTLVDLNVVGPNLVARAAARHLDDGGVLVDVSAVMAEQPLASLAATRPRRQALRPSTSHPLANFAEAACG